MNGFLALHSESLQGAFPTGVFACNCADYRPVDSPRGRRNVGRFRVIGTPKLMVADDRSDFSADQLAQLLAAVADSGDKEAFRRLFEYFSPRVRAFITRQGTDPGTSEEVVQETFINIWKKARLFDPEKAAVSTWIFAIARNARIDLLRKVHRPMPDFDDPAFVTAEEPSAHQLVSRAQESKRLKEMLAMLPPEQQEVLRLAFFEEKTHPEVAAELGVPLGTVKSRIRLALGRIRSELGDPL
jgi:RNA polymerase sigma-70 factor, ECF subfamily